MCSLFRMSVVNVQYAQDRSSICVICLGSEYLCTLIKNKVSVPFSQDQLSICAVCSGSEQMCTPSKVRVSVHFTQDQYSICSLWRGIVQYLCTPPNVSVVHVHFIQDQSSLWSVSRINVSELSAYKQNVAPSAHIPKISSVSVYCLELKCGSQSTSGKDRCSICALCLESEDLRTLLVIRITVHCA